MTSIPYQYRLREPYADPQARGAPVYGRTVEHGMIIERNIAVPLRDGVRVFADVFRPVDERPAPPIVIWTPYGKHWYGALELDPNTAVRAGMVSRYATFEGADPLHWVPLGYVVVNVDARGTWYSEGTSTFLSPEEAEAFYDVIEWAGVQPWSTGKVGLTGVSYLSQSQWKTAALQPPHLAAMNIWEGWSDTYREVARHGGIPDTSFWTKVVANAWGVSTHPIEDIVAETMEHPLFDPFWASKVADFSKIVVPAFIVASWTDQGLHERGTLEGFKKIASRQKWLEVHGRKKWSYYYEPHSVARLQAFFDKFLKDVESPIDAWPKVLLEVREKYYVGEQRGEQEWPLARTRYTRLHLDASSGTMYCEPVPSPASCRYDALGSGPGAHRAQFDYLFDETTELTGHMKLRVHMAAESADDMDIFVGIYKFDAHGEFVPMAYYTYFNDGPVALGWLRASHRELDAAASTDHQPVLAHRRELKLEPGTVVPLAIVPGGGLADYNKNVLLNPASGFYTGVPIDSRFITNSPYSTYSTFKDPSTGITLDPADNIDSWGVSNTVEWKTPIGVHIKNVLAYRGYSGNFAFDGGGAPLSDVMYSNPDFIHHQFSEEANIGDTAFNDKLDWVTGVYYYDGYSKQGNGPVLLTADEIVAPNPSPFCTTGCYGLNFLTNDPVTMIDKSFFIHTNYHITDQLSSEVGARYTDETKTYTFSRLLLPTNPQDILFSPAFDPNYPSLEGFQNNPSATSTTKRVDPKVALQYQWTPDIMTYGQYARGFKGGGINPHPVYASQVLPFKAETLASFELGIKTQWYGNRVRLNGAVFDSNYRDLQITVIGAAGADIIQNAGKVRIMGAEGEAQAEPVPKLVFNASFGYLYYHTIELGSAAGVPGGPTLDTAPPYIPTWKWNIGVQYSVAVPGFGDLTPRLDWNYQTKVFNDPSNAPLAEQPGYGLVSARLTWDTPHKGWQAALEIQNALNKVYYINKYDDLASFNVVDGQPGMPRTAFVSVRKNF